MALSEEKQVVGGFVEPATLERLLAASAGGPPRPPTRPPGAIAGGVGPTPEGSAPYRVVSYTSAGTNQWNYELAPEGGGGDASVFDGLLKVGTQTYPARNRWERLPMAGYTSSGVLSLRPIPVGAPVMAFWSVRDGKRILLFTERNEPGCP